ncbi:TIGR04255 family protein [Acinetobacter ursingii]|uniref:TIGR04255 family protein n=1 Tax=Acinetobacter ursingii TaxID=108980 RepID=UPI003AF48FB0
MSEYEKLTHQPLVVALAEFRFSVVLQIEQYVPQLQEYLRQDFPNFSTSETQEMLVEQNGVQINKSTRWLFVSSNKKKALILDRNRIVFITSEYDRFPDFWKTCKNSLLFIKEKIKPALLERIGLRYSDLIIAKQDNEDITAYVTPSICDKDSSLSVGQLAHRMNETVLSTDAGIMAIRSLYGYLNLSAWPDLMDSPVVIPKYDNISERILLDCDHSWQIDTNEVGTDFDVNFIESKIAQLHEHSRKAFWELTTPKGREAWK